MEEMTYRELRTNLADVLNRVEYRDETFIVTRRGKAVAQLTPIPQEPTMALSTDPRLLVHGVAPDGQPIAAQTDWERQGQRYRVHAVGTKTLGYVYLESVRSDNGSVRQEFRATTRDGVELGKGAALEDGAALVVAAAHGQASTTMTLVSATTDDVVHGVELGDPESRIEFHELPKAAQDWATEQGYGSDENELVYVLADGEAVPAGFPVFVVEPADTTTMQDLRDQITASITDQGEGIDVDAVAEKIRERFGVVDIDTIDSDEYWEIVRSHDATQASTHTLTIVRGEQPDAVGVEFGLAGITVSDEVHAWFAANGVSDDDPDVWVLVTPADEQPGAVNIIATRDV